MSKHTKKINMEEILNNYLPSDDDDDEMVKLKNIVYHLSEADKRIILLYTELGSQRKVANILKVSTSTINNRIKEIRNKILNRYDN